MAARLLLVASTDLQRLPDRLLVGDAAGLGLGMNAELARQLLQRHAQMHFALAPQHHFMCVVIMLEAERGILLDKLGNGAGELDLVLAVVDRDGETIDAGRGFERHQLRGIAFRRRQRFTGAGTFQAAKGDSVAGHGLLQLGRCRAHEREDAGHAAVLALCTMQHGAIRHLTRQHARQRQLAAMRGVEGLQHLHRRAVGLEAQPLRGFGDARRLVAKRFEQALDAGAMLGRAEQHGRDEAIRQLAGEVAEDAVTRRLHV